MNHLTPDDLLRSLILRALPSVENPHVAERAADFLVTGKDSSEFYPTGLIPARDFNRLDYAVHAALFSIANDLTRGAYIQLLTRNLPPLDD
jgi:hypothetical protein